MSDPLVSPVFAVALWIVIGVLSVVLVVLSVRIIRSESIPIKRRVYTLTMCWAVYSAAVVI